MSIVISIILLIAILTVAYLSYEFLKKYLSSDTKIDSVTDAPISAEEIKSNNNIILSTADPENNVSNNDTATKNVSSTEENILNQDLLIEAKPTDNVKDDSSANTNKTSTPSSLIATAETNSAITSKTIKKSTPTATIENKLNNNDTAQNSTKSDKKASVILFTETKAEDRNDKDNSSSSTAQTAAANRAPKTLIPVSKTNSLNNENKTIESFKLTRNNSPETLIDPQIITKKKNKNEELVQKIIEDIRKQDTNKDLLDDDSDYIEIQKKISEELKIMTQERKIGEVRPLEIEALVLYKISKNRIEEQPLLKGAVRGPALGEEDMDKYEKDKDYENLYKKCLEFITYTVPEPVISNKK